MASEVRSNLREMKVELTKRALLAAAHELFLAKGIRNTSIEDIARAAGTSRVTFYAYFADKRELVRAFIVNILDTSIEICRRFGELPDWSRASVRGWLRLHCEAWEANVERMKPIIREFSGEIDKEFFASNFGLRVDALLSNHAMWAHLPEDEARRRAMLLLGLIEQAMSLRYFGGWLDDRDALLDAMADIWCASAAPATQTRDVKRVRAVRSSHAG